MKQLTTEYNKHHTDLTNLGEAKTLQHHIDSLKSILELSTFLEAKLKLEGEKRIRKNWLSQKQKPLKE